MHDIAIVVSPFFSRGANHKTPVLSDRRPLDLEPKGSKVKAYRLGNPKRAYQQDSTLEREVSGRVVSGAIAHSQAHVQVPPAEHL